MVNQNKTKWKTLDYIRVISLFLFQGIFLILLFLLAGAYIKRDIGFISAYLTSGEVFKRGIYIFLAEILIQFIIFIYFYMDNRDFIKKSSNLVMLFSIINVSFVACFLLGKKSIYLRPFALCALLALFLVDKRSGILMNCFFSMIMMLFDLYYDYHFQVGFEVYNALIMNFISGTIAVFIVDGEGSRAKVIAQGLFISIPVVISAVFLELTLGLEVIGRVALYGLFSGLLSSTLLTVLLPFFEWIFGALTNFRLFELTNHKSKLIKHLMENAPGTFNHTIIVASLAEACSNAINLNPLLARACAYYHDLGKSKKPEFFTENQQGFNPHDELSPELSTDIIRAHAKDGADLIRKWRYPEVLATAAEQHHGTMPIRYFYAKAQKFTDGEVNIEDFSYYGPKPQNKANAIIMICDACEAKVRTVSNRTHENVDKAVKEIIEERMDMEQFSECDITFKELDIIRNTITNTLAGVYHDRVKYPKLKKGNKNGN